MHPTTIVVSFRSTKVEIPLVQGTTVQHVKEAVVLAHPQQQPPLAPTDIKLLLKGKVLGNDGNQDLYDSLVTSQKKPPKTFRILAMGMSPAEIQQNQQDFESQKRLAPRVRDDLSEAGARELQQHKRQGQVMLQKAAARLASSGQPVKYGFGKVETLPNLPHEAHARQILETLANDPGVLACMAKHQWHVGALAELYPEGKVGESAVCVMGLNENQGQRIRLRLRTDDLQGFRKILSIRKVLYHELAHNVHSEHDNAFFQLMRQVERECTELDWTQGAGLTSSHDDNGDDSMAVTAPYQGGTYRLGGGGDARDGGTAHQSSQRPHRELALQAALRRMTAEEHEIEQGCGCGRTDLFLPPSLRQSPQAATTAGDDNKSTTTTSSKHSSNTDSMDLS